MSIHTGLTERTLLRTACVMGIALLLCCSTSVGGAQHDFKRKITCKTPMNAASCYWAHGRLGAYNGTPMFRLWKIGTHRILGVYSGPDAWKRDVLDNEHPELPGSVNVAMKPFENVVFADFEICPLEPEHRGRMQDVCIESAKNVVVGEYSF